jgi:hypothetical protein
MWVHLRISCACAYQHLCRREGDVDKFYNPALSDGLALAVQELDSLGVQCAQAAARLYQSFQCAPGRRSRVSNTRGYCAVEREGSRGGVSEIASELAPWAV